MTEKRNIHLNPYPSPLVLVEEFHLTYGQKVRVIPNLNIPEREMRVALIEEEILELTEAGENDDFIEVVDALADILYVTYGAAIAHGVAIDHEFSNSHHISIAPVVKLTLDSEGTPLPKAPIFIRETFDREISQFKQAATDYANASANGEVQALTTALVRIILASYSLSHRFGVDIDDVLSEVQRSNMSKLGENGLPIIREDGKVLKGPNFFVPDIAKILREQGWNANI